MPKGTIRNPGTASTNKSRTSQRLANESGLRQSAIGKQRRAKAANEWNEYRAAGTDTAGHATKSLRKSMIDVRSDKSVQKVPRKTIRPAMSAKKGSK